jgi:hypothetical protein
MEFIVHGPIDDSLRGREAEERDSKGVRKRFKLCVTVCGVV